MNRTLNRLAVGAAMLALILSGCGGNASTAPDAQVSAAVRASAHEMEPEADADEVVPRFRALLTQLRDLPALAPLFDQYQVPDPIVMDDDDAAGGLIELLHAVKVTLSSGTITITNRETGGIIFTAPRSDLASGEFHPENLPTGTVPPPAQCTYTYSEWGACQSDGTQTRTVVSASPSSCTGTPILSQPCTSTPPPPPPPVTTCTSFTYSGWGACQPDSTQTRTVLSSSPAGCTGGAPVTSQACVYTPPVTTCTSFTYSGWGACQPDSTQSRTVLSSLPAGCTGGAPVTSQACVYTPPVTTCTSFTYSAWGACQPDNTQSRTVLSSAPAGCTGGTPVLTQACVYSPPPDGAALYGQYCAGCHGPLATSNLKGRNMSVASIKSRNMTQGLNDAQLQAIVDVVGP
ncbi:cytochrome c [Anaeromyxobacter terrae]|uniref:cytochrome c n=1 Tax=Anaeromyxobacter terrae TaxID=2925406 RepID=UPI001F56AEDA|nr:cytochrome c [Anaeromyxobacter sp. SG22]